jgi:hypothetical protein
VCLQSNRYETIFVSLVSIALRSTTKMILRTGSCGQIATQYQSLYVDRVDS